VEALALGCFICSTEEETMKQVLGFLEDVFCGESEGFKVPDTLKVRTSAATEHPLPPFLLPTVHPMHHDACQHEPERNDRLTRARLSARASRTQAAAVDGWMLLATTAPPRYMTHTLRSRLLPKFLLLLDSPCPELK
jgi:hypothetical protein